MNRIIAMIMAALLVLSLAACAANTAEVTTNGVEDIATTEHAPEQTTAATVPLETVTVENPVVSAYLSLGRADGAFSYLSASNYGTEIHVEMQADVKKVATMPAWVLHGVAQALEDSGMLALNGRSEFTEGAEGATAYADFADGTSLVVEFGGVIPREFLDAYAAVEAYFLYALQNEPVYVPQPIIEGQLDEDLKQELLGILYDSGMQMLDGFFLTAVEKDEFMGHTLGLADTTHVSQAVSCQPMMQPNAYSLVVVRVDSDAHASAVADDFAANLNWGKWVCVRADYALVAAKGDLVLCLMGSSSAFTGTKSAIQDNGWEILQEFKDPR